MVVSKPTARGGEAKPSNAGTGTAMLSFLWVDLLMAMGPRWRKIAAELGTA
jgi:hypothetical protein